MTYEEKQNFLYTVGATIKSYPELLNETIMACTNGTNDYINTLRHQVADFETIAVGFMSMSKGRYSKKTDIWANTLVLNKLKKYKNCSYVNWITDIEELENLLNKDRS
jgi:hypothetical protein